MLDTKKLEELLAKFPEEPVTDADLEGFVRDIGMPVPDDLRAWLKMANGPSVPPRLFGLRTRSDIESILEIHPNWKMKKWIPIGNDGCGNYYVVPTQQEFGAGFPVMFIDTMEWSETPTYLVASSVGAFLKFFLESEIILSELVPLYKTMLDEGAWGNRLAIGINDPRRPKWPFDKQYVVERDPGILGFSKELLPWEVDKKSRGA